MVVAVGGRATKQQIREGGKVNLGRFTALADKLATRNQATLTQQQRKFLDIYSQFHYAENSYKYHIERGGTDTRTPQFDAMRKSAKKQLDVLYSQIK